MERAMGKRSKERKGRIGWSKEVWVRRKNRKGERSGWIEMIDKKKGQIGWREKDQEWKGFYGKGGKKEEKKLDCIEGKEKGGNGMTWKQY